MTTPRIKDDDAGLIIAHSGEHVHATWSYDTEIERVAMMQRARAWQGGWCTCEEAMRAEVMG